MKVNISLVVLGAVAASAIALPAQAAVLTTNINVGGTVTPAAYQVTGVAVAAAPGTTFTIDFDHGRFAPTPGVTDNNQTTVYNGVLPTLPSGTALTADTAKAFGDAILAQLRADGVFSVIERTSITPPTYGQDIKQQFYIPYAVGPNGVGENRVAYCDVNSLVSATNCDVNQIQNINGAVMYAKFTPAAGTVPVPTPALIPGLLGMGLAAMRKKQQAA